MSGLAHCLWCDQVSTITDPEDLRVWVGDHESCWDHLDDDDEERYEVERMPTDDC